MAVLLCDREMMLCPRTVLLCCRCCQAPLMYVFLPCLLCALCHIAPTGLAASCGVGTHPSPTTFYPCGLSRPSTRFSRRLSTRAGRPVGGDPIYSPAFSQGPAGLYGPPPPAPMLRGDSAAQSRLCRFEFCTL